MPSIDHRARAEWLLARADGQEPEQAAHTVAKASVHAALAGTPDPADVLNAALGDVLANATEIRVCLVDGEAHVLLWNGKYGYHGKAGAIADAVDEAHAQLGAALAVAAAEADAVEAVAR